MRLCGRRCPFLCRRVFCCNCKCGFDVESAFERIFPLVDFLIRRVIGRFLFVLLYCLLVFILLVTVAIVIPYESLHKPWWALLLLCIFAVYLTLNVFYHFHKACTVSPGSPAKVHLSASKKYNCFAQSDKLPQCYRCNSHKPQNAHHCSICNACILNMDHHCIWINQCVGASNHRYFFQFIGFVTVGCSTFVLAAFNTFYYNYWHAFTNKMFCDSDWLASALPWFDAVCGRGPHLVVSSVFFTYLLCAIVSVLVGGLFLWNFVLISSGETYLGILMQSAGCSRVLRIAFFPHRHPRFWDHWRHFLGLDSAGTRTFWRHVLLPSAHSTQYELDALEGLTAADRSEEQQVLLNGGTLVV